MVLWGVPRFEWEGGMPGCAYGVYSNNGCVGHLFREPDISERRVRGVSAPRDEVLLFRQKDPKPSTPGRGPRGVPLPQSRLLGLRNSLRSDSPRPKIDFGTGAQPRPKAPGGSAV